MYKQEAERGETKARITKHVNMNSFRASRCGVEGMAGKDRMYRTRGSRGRLPPFKSSCLRSRSARCACRRTAGCCSSWFSPPALCWSVWWWVWWKGGRTPTHPALWACDTNAEQRIFTAKIEVLWLTRRTRRSNSLFQWTTGCLTFNRLPDLLSNWIISQQKWIKKTFYTLLSLSYKWIFIILKGC